MIDLYNVLVRCLKPVNPHAVNTVDCGQSPHNFGTRPAPNGLRIENGDSLINIVRFKTNIPMNEMQFLV